MASPNAPSIPVEEIKNSYEIYAQCPKFASSVIASCAESQSGVVKFFVQTSQKDVKRMLTRKGLLCGGWINASQFISSGACGKLEEADGSARTGGNSSIQGESDCKEKVAHTQKPREVARPSVMTFPMPCDMEGVSNYALDGSGIKLAIARVVPPKDGGNGKPLEPIIEVWANGLLQRVIKAAGKHGPVYDAENIFSGMCWSADGERLLYAAEEYLAEGVGFFDSSKGDAQPGAKYLKKESWGETMPTTMRPTIVVLHVASETFSFPLADASASSANESAHSQYAWGQPIWAPGDAGVVCVGYSFESRRPGLRFCLNRPSSLFYIPFKSNSPAGTADGTTSLSISSSVAGSGKSAALTSLASVQADSPTIPSTAPIASIASVSKSSIVPPLSTAVIVTGIFPLSNISGHVGARSPLFSPNGSTLVWLENAVGGPHAAPSRLMKLPWHSVIDGVHTLIASAVPTAMPKPSADDGESSNLPLGADGSDPMEPSTPNLSALDDSMILASTEQPMNTPPVPSNVATPAADPSDKADAPFSVHPPLLKVSPLPSFRPGVVVDIVQDQRAVGIYGERLPPSCFVSDCEMIFTTYHRSTRIVVHVDVSTDVMAPVRHHGIPSIADSVCDILFANSLAVLASISSLCRPPVLYLGYRDGVEIYWTAVTGTIAPEGGC